MGMGMVSLLYRLEQTLQRCKEIREQYNADMRSIPGNSEWEVPSLWHESMLAEFQGHARGYQRAAKREVRSVLFSAVFSILLHGNSPLRHGK